MPPWESFNCYKVLEVAPSASPSEIKSAYRAASRRHHPDLGGSHETMVRVNIAYEILSDPISRVSHDMYWQDRNGVQRGGSRRPPWPAPKPEPTTSDTTAGPRRTSAGRAPGARAGAQAEASRTHDPSPKASQGVAGAEPFASVRARVRKRTDEEAVRIRSGVSARLESFVAEYAKSVADARRGVGYSFAGFAVCGVIGFGFKPAFLGCAVAAVAFVTNAGGPRIRGLRRSAFLPSGSWVMKRATEAANEVTGREVAALDRYSAELTALVDLVLRESTLDHSESQIARRISVAFFLLGYVPLQYSACDRTLVFSDGDERVLVRFRHRDGAAVNVTVPQKLAASMRAVGVRRGYLFCSPGLSGNAAAFAAENGIHAYTIETMNEWINDTLAADYAGPEGDILAHLDTLKAFMAGLSRALPEAPRASTAWPRRRRRRRYW